MKLSNIAMPPTSHLSLLDDIGPMQGITPKKPSNRGRKPMQTTVLTSPDSVVVLRDKAKKSADRAAKRASESPKKKRGRPPKRQTTPAVKTKRVKTKSSSSSSSEDDADFAICLLCKNNLPKKLTAANSIECNHCGRPVHLKCAGMTTSYFTCKNYISDSD